MNDNLTLDALLEMKNRISTTLYYVTSDLVELGSGLMVNPDYTAHSSFPKYFVWHPDDLERLKEDNPTIKFIPLSEASLEVSMPPMRYKTLWSP